MIRHTHARCPQGTVKAYADNAGVIEGWRTPSFRPGSEGPFAYGYRDQLNHILCKVETHNHPTAISPFPGASTGVGGEIRDEGATGIGGWSQAGLCAFYTSHLRIPGFAQPWERDFAEFPERLATPLQIMTDGPLGGAAFGNEFGRPNILGLFVTPTDFPSITSYPGALNSAVIRETFTGIVPGPVPVELVERTRNLCCVSCSRLGTVPSRVRRVLRGNSVQEPQSSGPPLLTWYSHPEML